MHCESQGLGFAGKGMRCESQTQILLGKCQALVLRGKVMAL